MPHALRFTLPRVSKICDFAAQRKEKNNAEEWEFVQNFCKSLLRQRALRDLHRRAGREIAIAAANDELGFVGRIAPAAGRCIV